MENFLTIPATGNVDIINNFPADKYNTLIPVKIISQFSTAHRIVFRMVQIDTECKAVERGDDVIKTFPGREIYASHDAPGEYELTKKALDKLMAAANIQVIETNQGITAQCKRCAEIAKVARVFPNCGECEHRDDVAINVTVLVPEGIGSWRAVTSSKEIDVSVIRRSIEAAKKDKSKKPLMSEAQFNRFFPHRTSICESKAINRAIRKALALKSSYKLEELKKPFVMALVVPNMEDQEVKKAAVNAYFGVSQMLFKSLPQSQPGTITAPNGETITIEHTDPEEPVFADLPAETKPVIKDDPEKNFGRKNPKRNTGEFCSKCKGELTPGELKYCQDQNLPATCYRCRKG